MDEGAFTSTIKLEELDLSENKISFDDFNQPTWDRLEELKVLKLAKNENIALTYLPYAWTVLGNLRTLDLSNNRIGPIIEAASLHFTQKEIVVNLSNNRIKRVRFDPLVFLNNDRVAEGRKSNILLGGNPLNCDCSALELMRAVNGQSAVSLGFTLNGSGLKCAEPTALRNRNVTAISADELSCALPDDADFASVKCPSGCSCFFTPSLSRTTVDCSDAGLNALPEFVPLVPKATNVTLDLSNNRIPTLKDAASAVNNYSIITELDLSNNTIREVSPEDLPPNLSGIALADNNLTTFSADILKMRGLDWLRLGGNQYECGCQSKPLYDFLRTDSTKVRDRRNITLSCKGKATALQDMELDDFCISTETIVLRHILPLIVFLVLLLAIVVVVLFYRTRVCIWLYSKPKLRWIFVMCDPESEVMEYDVFVSYSEKDKDFVERTLLEELEHGSSIRYRCLVHARDFEPGRNIVEQIGEAVDKSRRTLIVLSRNFVTSDWYKHEFNLAHSANRVVVVVLGELPTQDQMGNLMWEYIKANTYLPYGGEEDKWFWDKLRYALPHKNEVPFRFMRKSPSDQFTLTENTKATAVDLNDKLGTSNKLVVELP
jgi:protein toll